VEQGLQPQRLSEIEEDAVDTTTPAEHTNIHYWPKRYHPLMGGGPTGAELLSEIGKAEANGRTVHVADVSPECWKVTVHIPAS
jgi:hypothetical protein